MLRRLFHIAGFALALVTGCGLLARFIPPDALWPPAIIALMLPGLLLATLIYFLILSWRKEWRQAIFPGLLLIFSIPLLPQLFGLNLIGWQARPAGVDSFKVLTTNVRHFKDDAWLHVGPDDGLKFVARSAPDVLLLQESYRGTGGNRYADAIKTASGTTMRHQPASSAVATFGDDIKFVSDQLVKNNVSGILVTDVETSLGTIRIVNAHLQSNQISQMASELGDDRDLEREVNRAGSMFRNYGAAAARRAGQAAYIRGIIDASPHPVIVGGDFNDVPSSYTYRQTLSPRLRDAWVVAGTGIGTTFTGPLPGLRIDYLMVDTALTVQHVERIETGFSDHRGLMATITRR